MLIQLIVTLLVIGIVLWIIYTFLPIDPKIKQLISVLVVLASVLYLLRAFALI